MKSTIYLDADFNFLLLENEESEDTQIFINVTTSEAGNQRLEISIAGGEAVTETIQSESVVNFRLSRAYWADRSITTITPKNDDITGETLELIFPNVFDTGGSLNYISDTEFEMSAQSEEYAGGGSSGGGYGSSFDFVEIIRNIGYRLLNEPTNATVYYDSVEEAAKIRWTDPPDISTNEPCTATWAGTVVVRKETEAPKHRWDGTLIIDSTTRDEYAETALVDSNVDPQKTYYYGIFPYDTRGWYRYTKTVSFYTNPLPIPEIVSLEVNGGEITVTYSVPAGYSWSEIGVVYKKNSAPTDRNDGNTVDVTTGTGSVIIGNLTGNTTYYFRIYSTEATTLRQYLSDAKSAETGDLPVQYVIYGLFISDYQT